MLSVTLEIAIWCPREAQKLPPSPLTLYVPVQQSPDQSEGVRLPGWKIHPEGLEESDPPQRDNAEVCSCVTVKPQRGEKINSFISVASGSQTSVAACKMYHGQVNATFGRSFSVCSLYQPKM